MAAADTATDPVSSPPASAPAPASAATAWPLISPAQLHAYLTRIGFAGEARPDVDTLRRIHRAHAESVTWECLDVQLGRRTGGLDPRAAYEKIVLGGRGGWCYEMNGLLGWALQGIGFSVTRLSGAVAREHRGDSSIGNHLVLLVRLPKEADSVADEPSPPWLCDVGFGSGLLEPVSLQANDSIAQSFMRFKLESLPAQPASQYGVVDISVGHIVAGGGWWRFHNHPGLSPPSYDFCERISNEGLMARKCSWHHTSAESSFFRTPVVARYYPDRLEMLVRNVARTLYSDGRLETQVIPSARALTTRLRDVFKLDVPELEQHWDEFTQPTTAAASPAPASAAVVSSEKPQHSSAPVDLNAPPPADVTPLPSSGPLVLGVGRGAGVAAQAQNALRAQGFRARVIAVDDSPEGDASFLTALAEQPWEAVSLGGHLTAQSPQIERSPQLTVWFNRVLNLLHTHAPQAKIVLVTGPEDLAPAFRRELGIQVRSRCIHHAQCHLQLRSRARF